MLPTRFCKANIRESKSLGKLQHGRGPNQLVQLLSCENLSCHCHYSELLLAVLDESLEPIIVENSVHNQLLGANANDSAISTIVADQAADRIRSQIRICREDIARAKTRILKMMNGNVEANATDWLADTTRVPREIDLDQAGIEQILQAIAKTIGLKQAFFQAAIELSCNGCIALLGGIHRPMSE